MKNHVNNERGAIGAAIIAGISAGVAAAGVVAVGWAVAIGVAVAGGMYYMSTQVGGYGDSPTYGGAQLNNTGSEGLPIPICYGRVKVAGNKIRYNHPDDDWQCLLVSHCKGVISGVNEVYVNDIEWSELKDGDHEKTLHYGNRTQGLYTKSTGSGVVFGEKTCAYRGVAYTVFAFRKDDPEVGWDPAITVELDGKLCRPLEGGDEYFVRNNAGILFDWYQTVEGYRMPWRQLPNHPEYRKNAVAAIVGNIIYLGMGHITGTSGGANSDKWYSYNINTNKWTELTSISGRRNAAMGAECNGKIYVGGGVDYGVLQDFYEYNISTDTWTAKANLPTKMYNATACSLNGKFYAGTGNNGVTDITKNWYCYDPATNLWTSRADFPVASKDMVSISCGGYIYAGLGDGEDSWYRYDVSLNVWEILESYPSASVGNVCAVMNGDIYAGTGSGVIGIVDNWYKYDIASDTWSSAVGQGAEHHPYGSAVGYNGKIYKGLGERNVEKKEWFVYEEEYDKNAELFNFEAFKSLEGFCNQVPSSGVLPRYQFDFVYDTDININDAKKTMFQAFNGQVIQSQGKLKPVWDSNVQANGFGGVEDKTSSFEFTIDNIIDNSISWSQPERSNAVRIIYLDSDRNYQKTTCELRDEIDIEQNGEILFEESCWWITDSESARRRCQFKYNKFLFTDYNVKLSALSAASKLELFDLVTVTHPLPGWTAKQFIVIGRSEDENGLVDMSLEAYYSGVYNDSLAPVQDGYGELFPETVWNVGEVLKILTYDDADLSGVPVIIELTISPLRPVVMFKAYPTISAKVNPLGDGIQQNLSARIDADISNPDFDTIVEFYLSGERWYSKAYGYNTPLDIPFADRILGEQISYKEISDSDIYGTPRIGVFPVNGIEYYYKVYPNRRRV